ncbi:MAG: peptidylprolyl isomerase [Gemmatimonadota bacterium]
MSGFRGLLALALIVALAGCDDSSTVAKAAGHELSVEDGVALLGDRTELPNEPEVAEALANIWVDYILLANLAMDDSTFASVDFSPAVRPEIEQELVYRLRQEVVQVDTMIGEDELRTLYAERAPGAEVRARHILLDFPEGATEEQRDSVLALAGELRSRAVGGESFATLAEQFSSDLGSARQGGDLGFFDRNQMIEPFSDAAFALQPGEVSEPVESIYGIHVIRVEERRSPDFDEVREAFLAQLRSERMNEAELAYLEGLEEAANIRIADDAFDEIRSLAQRPEASLSARAGRKELTSYEGGAFTAADFQEFLQARPPTFALQVQQAADEDLEEMLKYVTRSELLVREALRMELDLSDEEKAEMEEAARTGFGTSARGAGLHNIAVENGESRKEAIDRVIMERLRNLVSGQGDVIPLGPLAFTLRKDHDAEVNPRGVAKLVERIAEVRGPEPELPDFLREPAPETP